ncbi:MAG: aromatic ring-hydroxylating dioxygenase subunit alpha [Actinobacteria bacterium]|nr:aromatic ring-hydroxylating dioxygenase subunit alpha [Actinomycetota bacterium]
MRSTASPPAFLLPREAYCGDEWFEREQSLLFAHSWQVVASVDDLASAGDYVTATVGGVPLVVVRGDDGGLRGYHNMCRHRGMALLEGCGNAGGAITCFYHEWRYDLDGELRVVPQRKAQFPDLDLTAHSLLEASVGVWEGMVFANPDPLAVPLMDELGELPGGIGSHRPGLLPVVARADLSARCNWKLLVENHIDVYHLWYLHKRSLADLDHTKFQHTQLGRHWASYEPLRSPDLATARLVRGTRVIGHIDERDRFGVGAHLIFPNVLLAANAEFFMSYAVVPVGPAECRMELRIRAEAGADGDALLDAARSFIDEDIHACERIQAAMASPWFEVGPLAREHEAPITAFHEHLLAELVR